jgi:hypothetical protein
MCVVIYFFAKACGEGPGRGRRISLSRLSRGGALEIGVGNEERNPRERGKDAQDLPARRSGTPAPPRWPGGRGEAHFFCSLQYICQKFTTRAGNFCARSEETPENSGDRNSWQGRITRLAASARCSRNSKFALRWGKETRQASFKL